jgi:hypothetical protein
MAGTVIKTMLIALIETCCEAPVLTLLGRLAHEIGAPNGRSLASTQETGFRARAEVLA